MTAIGKDPQNVAGFDLLLPLGDFDETVSQGVNGAIFALLALDSRNYEIPVNPEADTQATREFMCEEILRREIPTGGWALTGGEPDADVTAMALQALAKYARTRMFWQPSSAALRRWQICRSRTGRVYLVGRGKQRVCLAGDRRAHRARYFSG